MEHHVKKMFEPAKALWEAKENYDNAFEKLYEESELIDESKFWGMVNNFLSELRYRCLDGRGSIYDSADEFTRKIRCSETNGVKTKDLIPFLKMYREKCHALYEPLFNIVENRSDDSYGDFLDAFPLLGKGMYYKAINKEFRDNDHIEAEICSKVHNDSGDLSAEKIKSLVDMFINGESYFKMNFEDAIKKSVKYECITYGE
jgi:hypothetical protein